MVHFIDWFPKRDALIKDAEMRVAAAQGNTVVWRVPTKNSAEAIRELIDSEQIRGLIVEYCPMPNEEGR
ncbi:hypothetical protein L1O03_11060 [Corynebacterium uropygiale]|uniref:Uncharacterized protein n=1 Tax=Corynebacterium uropygiale TaxID=1775911 RepID=A0A9X1U8C9_9CORY|nr:hypothetical protein [Corynebacterium uropygiale]MCF4007702.1 hypothetical protein [Corynebacterium uropygiale]